MPMRQDCKYFESRTYANGDTVRKCDLDLAPEAPWRCPDDCPKYTRRMADVNWSYGSLVTPETRRSREPGGGRLDRRPARRRRGHHQRCRARHARRPRGGASEAQEEGARSPAACQGRRRWKRLAATWGRARKSKGDGLGSAFASGIATAVADPGSLRFGSRRRPELTLRR